jgi:hypothetical protein
MLSYIHIGEDLTPLVFHFLLNFGALPGPLFFTVFLKFSVYSTDTIFILGDGLMPDTPAASLDAPAAAPGKICSYTFLLLDFPWLNQGIGAGRDSNPGLPYSSSTR